MICTPEGVEIEMDNYRIGLLKWPDFLEEKLQNVHNPTGIKRNPKIHMSPNALWTYKLSFHMKRKKKITSRRDMLWMLVYSIVTSAPPPPLDDEY
jgi:hypothetical protein